MVVYSTFTEMCVKGQCKKVSTELPVVGTSTSCVFSKVTWRCHVFLEMCGVFVNDVTKFVCVMMIDVCIKCSENHMTGFLVSILCTSAYCCIFVYIVVWDCRQSRVIWNGIFGLCFLLWKSAGDLQLSDYSCSYK